MNIQSVVQSSEPSVKTSHNQALNTSTKKLNIHEVIPSNRIPISSTVDWVQIAQFNSY
jgi:hypothetical protein